MKQQLAPATRLQATGPRFIISAARPDQFPPDTGVEAAFLGRSNVGKSSLLNALMGVKGLAKTSARPGCTQLINFYQVEEALRFADLPGYGFAKVPREVVSAWKALIDSYLTGRASLRMPVIVLDARRGWMEKDLELKDWLECHGRPFIVAATKMDKLKSHKEKHASAKALREAYAGEIFECSAETGRGVREIWQAISKIKTSL
jgi:GTP-binding protein